MPAISERTTNLGTENAFVVLKEVNELVSQGKDIVSFCIGQPDFDTPENIKHAGKKAIHDGKSGYTASCGIPELRQAVAKYFSDSRNIEVKAEDIVVAGGAKPFIGFSVLACTDAGQGHEVIYPTPGYPIYESQIKVHGAKPVALPLLEKENFAFDINTLKSLVTDKTRLLILNTPQNPTGGILSRDILEEIADLAIKNDFWVFADEIYWRLSYDRKFESIASVPGMLERTILVDGMSKAYAMTGWRIGFAANRSLAPHFTNWVTNAESCAGHPNQWASVEALTGSQDEVDKMINTFKKRRDLIVKGLNEIPGFSCLSPGGAFYAFPNVTEACKMVGAKSSDEFRKMLLNEVGVAVLADTHFGAKVQGEGEHIRFSYANSSANINEGLRRVKEFMEKKN